MSYAAVAAVSVVVTVAAIAVLNGGPLLVPTQPARGEITLSGITTHFVYASGVPPVYGAVQQDCGECPLYGSGGSIVGINNLSYAFSLPSVSVIVTNNVTSFVPVQADCESPPSGGCPFVTSTSARVQMKCGVGYSTDWALTFSVPEPAPTPPAGGWWLYVTANISESSCP